MRKPLNLRKLDKPRPCSACRGVTEFGTAGGRPLHPACSIGFELFNPEAEVEVEERTLLVIRELGAQVVAAVSW